MGDWYAPNQQAVRADESGPAEEGGGGAAGAAEPQPEEERSLDSMTKDELLELAGDRADPSMTKAEIKAAIQAG